MTAYLYVSYTNSMYLWLGEHVEAPGAHFAISGNADQVVSILGPYHVHAVDWVLSTVKQQQSEELDNIQLPRKPRTDVKTLNTVLDIKVCELRCLTVCAAADRGVL